MVGIPGLRGHRRVLLDTSVWIYHFEQHETFGAAAGLVMDELEAGRFQGLSSELTLLELTVKPLQLGRQDVADEYELLLNFYPNFQLFPVSREVLLDAAGLRARYRLRTPDAIVLATGLQAGATVAVTNDAWPEIPEIRILKLSELNG